MNYFLTELLKGIKGPLQFIIDGEVSEYMDGNDAVEKFSKLSKTISLKSIYAKDSMLVLALSDVSNEIEKKNNEFTDVYKRQFGIEPSFF